MDLRRKQLVIGAVALQGIHLLAFVVLKDAKVASNTIQIFMVLLTCWVCWSEGRLEKRHSRQPWNLVCMGLLLWTAAQIAFLAWVVTQSPTWVPVYETFWLLFPFPMILVAFRLPPSPQRDIPGGLDLVQACIFFCTLFALVFAKPDIISFNLAYEVQSLALPLAFALRLSMTLRGSDRTFYRYLTVFSILYAASSSIGYIAEIYGLPSGTFVDLCWVPAFTVYSILIARGNPVRVELRKSSWLADPTHLHGVSALGLAAMSLGAAATLALHRQTLGTIVVALAFLLFGIRISLREWQSHRFHTRIEYTLTHDALTGLGNRAYLQHELSRCLNEPPEADHCGTALLFIDLDRFKAVNDDFGHSFGDELLKEVASLLRSSVRKGDIIARHGGDEFVILLEQVQLEEARTCADGIAKKMRAPMKIDGRVVHLSASIGLALSSSSDRADTLLQDADTAMYKAKQSGKDRIQIFTPDLIAGVKNRNTLLTDLRSTLDAQSFEVHYQPIYGLWNHSVVGFEALARWRHPERGIISPAEFIPLAEETGLINELGRQILRKAAAQCHAWNLQFGTALSVSVNVSAHQFANPDLLETIQRALSETGLSPALLKLEITESVLLSGYEGVAEVLASARSLGIGICLDDFGTGYSSLSYLLNFPFDIVKIDKSFVTNLDSKYDRAEMVRSITDLGRRLDMQIVAEGVETIQELARLQEFNCDMVQGFLLSKPLDAQTVQMLLTHDELSTRYLDRLSELQTHIAGTLLQ
ncbi:putative bifunctional diguanylate cyclase/phosphodiesterase [Granulicella aggregans]|uniref:putative bifunctional diguanylate cyclase/phosphodiesterase n=1 Tax=Granulicella aggregans TaxID=474949 RepID=UPI0021DFC64B|nr:EAL domain-containing protein [Granulicella aggregans]